MWAINQLLQNTNLHLPQAWSSWCHTPPVWASYYCCYHRPLLHPLPLYFLQPCGLPATPIREQIVLTSITNPPHQEQKKRICLHVSHNNYTKSDGRVGGWVGPTRWYGVHACVRMLLGSAPRFSRTRAATPSPSRNRPRSKCSVPM